MTGSLLITDRTSHILYASDGCATRTGFDVPEIIGKRPADLWGGLMPKNYYERMWDDLRLGGAWSRSVLNRRKNGEQVTERLHIAPVLDEKGEARYFLELRPRDVSSEFERDFERILTEAMRPTEGPGRLVRVIDKWLDPMPASAAPSRQAFLQVLEERYILPTRDRFERRLQDRWLVEQAKSIPEQFAVLYEKYTSRVRSFFQYRLSDTELAEDLTQEVFVRAFRALPGYTTTNASYLTYLLRIAHNVLVSEYRSSVEPETSVPARMGWIERFERRDILDRAIDVLSELERQILICKYREGYSVREIATELNRSENAVKLHLSRARRKLREEVKRSRGVR